MVSWFYYKELRSSINHLDTEGEGRKEVRWSPVGMCFFIFVKILQAVVRMQIPHFRRPFYPSVWFSFPVPHFRENEGWGSPEQSFDTLWQKKSNLARILGQMVRISQKVLIIL